MAAVRVQTGTSRVTSASSSTPLPLRSSPACVSRPPSAHTAPGATSVLRATTCAGASAQRYSVRVTSASSSTPLPSRSSPVPTACPPKAHAAPGGSAVKRERAGA
nr:hypothetical protein [Corallococcus interemptor]